MQLGLRVGEVVRGIGGVDRVDGIAQSAHGVDGQHRYYDQRTQHQQPLGHVGQ